MVGIENPAGHQHSVGVRTDLKARHERRRREGRIEPLDVRLLALDEQFALRAGAVDLLDLVLDGVADQAHQQLGEIAGIAPAENRGRRLADVGPGAEHAQEGQRPRGTGRIDLAEDLDGNPLVR